MPSDAERQRAAWDRGHALAEEVVRDHAWEKVDQGPQTSAAFREAKRRIKPYQAPSGQEIVKEGEAAGAPGGILGPA